MDDMNVAFEVRTDTLTDDPEDGAKILQIELHEVGYVAKLLLREGDTARPDECIAVLCDRKADVELFADFPMDVRTTVESGTFAWQAYLKAGETARSCSI